MNRVLHWLKRIFNCNLTPEQVKYAEKELQSLFNIKGKANISIDFESFNQEWQKFKVSGAISHNFSFHHFFEPYEDALLHLIIDFLKWREATLNE